MSCNFCILEFNLPVSFFQPFSISAILSTFKSKSNLNIFSTVDLLLLCDPKITSFSKNSPLTSNTFRVSDSESQPFSATTPETFFPKTEIPSLSKNETLLNCALKVAKWSFLITLPKLLSCWYVPPVDPIPLIEYETVSVPPVVFTPVTVK